MVTEDETDFVRSLGLGFLAHRLKRASEFILEQSAAARRSIGFDVPTRSGSTLLLLSREGPRSITEIAFRLQLSHPFVITICDRLIGAGLATSNRDEVDGRRRVIALTDAGVEAAHTVERFAAALATAFSEIFEELGVDLLAALDAFERAAVAPSIADRTRDAFTAESEETKEAECSKKR